MDSGSAPLSKTYHVVFPGLYPFLRPGDTILAGAFGCTMRGTRTCGFVAWPCQSATNTHQLGHPAQALRDSLRRHINFHRLGLSIGECHLHPDHCGEAILSELNQPEKQLAQSQTRFPKTGYFCSLQSLQEQFQLFVNIHFAEG